MTYKKMDGQHVDKQPLRERVRRLGDQVESLNHAIHAELDWREKLRPVQIDDWDEDEAV